MANVQTLMDGLVDRNFGSQHDLGENVQDVDSYLAFRDSRQVAMDTKLEALAKKGFLRCLKALGSQIRAARSELKPLDKNIFEFKAKIDRLESEQELVLRQMAAAQLRRVGAPKAGVREAMGGFPNSFDLMIAVATCGAPREAFNDLYAALVVARGPQALPPWECSAEAVTWPERDMLGMCPGGKPHLTEDQLEERGEKRCHCAICVCKFKLQELENQGLAKMEARAAELRKSLRELSESKRVTRRVFRRLRGSATDGGGDGGDPVFYDDEQPFDEEACDEHALEVHRRAEVEWGRLEATLSPADLPLRIVFLDKSGSMGCDEITYESLQLGLHNCLNPESGATLTFLFAAAGETEIFLRRPGDAPIRIEISLGSATWFNEPILRTLRFLAPIFERLDTLAWMRQAGQVPLQVLCLTDGQDNCSPSEVRTLSGLVRKLKEIVGPTTQQKLYTPIVGPVKKHSSLLDAEGGAKIPVYLAWIACGMGGQSLLDSKAPAEVCIIDAVAAPRFREEPAQRDSIRRPSIDDGVADRPGVEKSTTASRARRRMRTASVSNEFNDSSVSSTMWSVGHRVRVRAGAPGRAPKAALVERVLAAEDDQSWPHYELLFDDETRATIEGSQLLGAPVTQPTHLRRSSNAPMTKQLGLLARSAEPDMQRLQVLTVVDEATRDLGKMMQSRDAKGGRLSLEDATTRVHGSEQVGDVEAQALECKLIEAKAELVVAVAPQVCPGDPREVVLDAMRTVGLSAGRLQPEDRLVAQRILSVCVEMFLCGGAVMPAHLVDQLGVFSGLAEAKAMRRIRVKAEEIESWHESLARPCRDLIDLLLRRGLVEKNVQHMTVNGAETVSLSEDAQPCLLALRRFLDPTLMRCGVEDALRRAVNRYQRLQHEFSFCLTSTAGGGSDDVAGIGPAAAAFDSSSSPPRSRSASNGSSGTWDGGPFMVGSSPVSTSAGSSSRPRSASTSASCLGSSSRSPASASHAGSGETAVHGSPQCSLRIPSSEPPANSALSSPDRRRQQPAPRCSGEISATAAGGGGGGGGKALHRQSARLSLSGSRILESPTAAGSRSPVEAHGTRGLRPARFSGRRGTM